MIREKNLRILFQEHKISGPASFLPVHIYIYIYFVGGHKFSLGEQQELQAENTLWYVKRPGICYKIRYHPVYFLPRNCSAVKLVVLLCFGIWYFIIYTLNMYLNTLY